MSYLVDALKKAERERHQFQAGSVASISAGEAPGAQRGGGRTMRWVVGVLVVCNAVLLLYLFTPGAPVSEALEPSTPAPSTVAASPPTAEPATQATRSTSAGDAPLPSGTPSSRPASARNGNGQGQDQGSGNVQLSSLRLSNPAPARSQPSSGGRVTYSQTPLDDSGDFSAAGQSSRQAPMQNAGSGNLPAVSINGHLYSSVPGRSFILVNGRRYHEGERLAAGPAVESIDVTGATLNYQGQRYHVKGPS